MGTWSKTPLVRIIFFTPSPDTPILILATKIDLRDDEEILKKLKEKDQAPIDTDLTKKLASEVNAIGWGECSAKTQKGLKEAFNIAIEAVLKPMGNPTPGNNKKKKDCSLL